MLRWRNLKIAGYFMAGFQSTILDNGSYDVNSYTGFPTSGQPSFCCAPGDQRQLELSVHCLIGTGTALARARQGSGPSLPSGLSDYPSVRRAWNGLSAGHFSQATAVSPVLPVAGGDGGLQLPGLDPHRPRGDRLPRGDNCPLRLLASMDDNCLYRAFSEALSKVRLVAPASSRWRYTASSSPTGKPNLRAQPRRWSS